MQFCCGLFRLMIPRVWSRPSRYTPIFGHKRGYRTASTEQIAAQSSTLFDVIGEFEITAPFELAANPERVYIQAVTENFFSALRGPATIGRVLESGDDHVAVLSHSGWG